MRLIEALAGIGDRARFDRRPLPVISMSPCDLVSLSQAIEADLGGRLYSHAVSRGFQYDGISFVPAVKPRIRVKAGRRVVRNVPINLRRPQYIQMLPADSSWMK